MFLTLIACSRGPDDPIPALTVTEAEVTVHLGGCRADYAADNEPGVAVVAHVPGTEPVRLLVEHVVEVVTGMSTVAEWEGQFGHSPPLDGADEVEVTVAAVADCDVALELGEYTSQHPVWGGSLDVEDGVDTELSLTVRITVVE